jgi:hypothetical protein
VVQATLKTDSTKEERIMRKGHRKGHKRGGKRRHGKREK